MIKKLLILLIFSLPAFAFETDARYALLIDYDTDTILFEKNANIPMYPSSMSKLMTAYVVFDRIKYHKLDMDNKFIISEKAWKKQGSKMFVHVGDRVSVRDLLMGVIVQSGNDACIALAEGIAGSEEEFAKLMNKKSKEIGLTDSHFVNATGWPDEAHVMSSRDLALLAKRLIADYPEYYHLFSVKDFVFNKIKQGNRNILLYRNVGVDGLKTGHTDIAGYGITVSAKRGDRRLILVVNGLESNIKRANEAERIFDYGFLNFDNITLAKKGKEIANIEVWMGRDKNFPVIAGEDIIVTIPKDRQKDLKLTLEHEFPLKAPIKVGDKIADLIVEVPGLFSKAYPILSNKEVKKLPFLSRIFVNAHYLLFGIKSK
jgi:D-alanyl-D-alanine carboxypeptidase (penicillin-binding protein 5/6)